MVNQIIVESKNVKDLSDEELLNEYKSVCGTLEAEYKILVGMKTTRKEILTEILTRFGGKK